MWGGHSLLGALLSMALICMCFFHYLFIHSAYKHSQVDHITQTIAYPDEIENDDWLNALYANVSWEGKGEKEGRISLGITWSTVLKTLY